jgi:hypothetical protein
MKIAADLLKEFDDLDVPVEELRLEIDRLAGRLRNRTSFPANQPPNAERRATVLADGLRYADPVTYETRERSVRVSAPAVDVHTYLRGQYINQIGTVVCQICRQAMPFKKRDGDYYFEAVEVSKELPVEHEAKYLALCPTCAAKYAEYVKSSQEVETELVGRIGADKRTDGDIPDFGLALDQPARVRFTETHLLDLRVVLQRMNSDLQNEWSNPHNHSDE